MQITFLIYSMDGGGAQRVFTELINNFASRGYKTKLALAQKRGSYLEQIDQATEIIDLDISGFLKGVFKIARYLRKEKPEVLLSTMNTMNVMVLLASVLARHKGRVVVREANILSLSLKKTKAGKAFLLSSATKVLYPKADKIIANSKGMVRDLTENFSIPENKIVQIYLPLNIKKIREKAEEALDHPWMANPENRVVLSVGSLTEQKDYTALLKAFSKIDNKYNLKLIILGEGPERDKLERLSRKLGIEERVSMPGFASNPYSYMKHADAFVLTSKWEGIPNVLIEAIAVGTPVISTDCKWGPAEILQNGKYGKLVPVGDYTSLSRAITDTINASPDTEEAFAYVESTFSIEKISEEYLDIIRG